MKNDSYYKVSVKHIQEKNWTDAIESLKKFLESNPDHQDANHKIAESLKEVGKLEEAVKHYSKAIQLNPKSPYSYRGLGEVLEKQGKLEKAIAAYRDSLALKPDYGLVKNKLTKALEEETRLKQAEAIKASQERLLAFKDKHKGERCVIIGNGPSLNKMDLSFLKNEICFGMNRIYLGFDKLGCIPNYYLSVNRLVIEQSANEILNIPSPKFLSNKAISYLPNREDLIFIQTYPYSGDFFSTNPQDGLAEGNTVTYFAMQLAYYMGFETVILIGVDHYFATKGPAHKEIISDGDDPNHFHPGYFGKGVKWHLPDLDGSEKYYKIAKAYFEADGRTIIDATFEGHCTIFPKVDYRDLFFFKSVSTDFFLSRHRKQKLTIKQPKISLALFAESNTTNIQETLKSIVTQSYQDYEVIVVSQLVEDTSETWKIAHDSIRYLKNDGKGKLAAYNHAINLAQGDSIFFIDANSILLPNSLKLLASSFTDVDVLLSSWQEYQEEIIIDIDPWLYFPDLNNWHICKFWQLWQVISISPVIFRTSFLKNSQGFDERLSPDLAKLNLVISLLSSQAKPGWLYHSVCRLLTPPKQTNSHLPKFEEIKLIMDNFFSQSEIPEEMLCLESRARHNGLVWLAWMMYNSGYPEKMGEYLELSLDYLSFPPMEAIVNWIEHFTAFSKIYQSDLDAHLLTESRGWEELTQKIFLTKTVNSN